MLFNMLLVCYSLKKVKSYEFCEEEPQDNKVSESNLLTFYIHVATNFCTCISYIKILGKEGS